MTGGTEKLIIISGIFFLLAYASQRLGIQLFKITWIFLGIGIGLFVIGIFKKRE